MVAEFCSCLNHFLLFKPSPNPTVSEMLAVEKTRSTPTLEFRTFAHPNNLLAKNNSVIRAELDTGKERKGDNIENITRELWSQLITSEPALFLWPQPMPPPSPKLCPHKFTITECSHHCMLLRYCFLYWPSLFTMEVPVVVLKQRASSPSWSLELCLQALSLFRCCPLSFDFSYDVIPKQVWHLIFGC